MSRILSRSQIVIAALGLSLGASGYCAYGQTVPTAQTGSSQPAPPAQKSAPKQTDQKAAAKTPAKTAKAKTAKAKTAPSTEASAEPDKVLYDRAVADIKKGRYIEGRLTYQTLINTYPDSEYLAKAKLGVADSYFKEGGTSSITQSVQEYKDFITFFPFLDEAAYAQMQVAMAHYRMMEKPDRDKSQAENAEDEFQAFLLKYPQSPLVPKAEQSLREVQEILADSQFRVARFYYLKLNYSASAARLMDLSQRYPLYSQGDEALWMLGDIYEKAKQVSKNEDDKNHWADLAAECYQRIIKNYPLSHWTADAKSQLTAMGMPVPAPDPNAEAAMRKEQMYEKQHRQFALLRLPMGLMKSSPDVTLAARHGQPTLNPPDDAISATEVLKPGAAGPSFNLTARPAATDPNSAPEQGAPVEAVSVEPQSSGAAGNSVGAQIIEAPSGDSATSANTRPNAGGADPAPEPSSPPSITLEPASGNATSPAPAASTPATTSSTTSAGTVEGGGTIAPVAEEKADKADSKAESTSKKKKGIHKVIPF